MQTEPATVTAEAANAEPSYAELAVSQRNGEHSRVPISMASRSIAIYATIDHTAAGRNKSQSTKLFTKKKKNLQSSKSNDV